MGVGDEDAGLSGPHWAWPQKTVKGPWCHLGLKPSQSLAGQREARMEKAIRPSPGHQDIATAMHARTTPEPNATVQAP